MTVPITVKHGGKRYEIQLDTSKTVDDLKKQLYEVTSVPPERQKLLSKGLKLKDDVPFSELTITPNHVFMMLGTAGELPKAPPKVDIAIGSTEVSEPRKPDPPGLLNLGNTCYANAALQALNTVTPLSDSIKQYEGNDRIVQTMGMVFRHLSSNRPAYSPALFLVEVRAKFPQFAEMGPYGAKQQDAEELWTQLLTVLGGADSLNASDGMNVVEKYFQGEFVTSLKCLDVDEPVVKGHEAFNKLSCHITISTNFLKDGLLSGLSETIEKQNESLGRNAKYELEKRISKLPKFLTIQFVRFFWRRDTGKKSKILRRVTFPFKLDLTDLCDDALREQLLPAKDALHEMCSELEQARRIAKRVNNASHDKKRLVEEVLPAEKFEELRAKVLAATSPELLEYGNPYGVYELAAVVTHRGMSADSGHYQAFTRNDDNPGTWWRYDDDKVSLVEDSKIESLSGGGESDSALILVYRTPELPGGAHQK